MIRLGSSKVKIYLGNTPIKAVYKGTEKIYPEDQPVPEQLVTILPGGTQAVIKSGNYVGDDGQPYFLPEDRTVTLNDTSWTPGTGSIQIPTETSQWSAPPNMLIQIDDYNAHDMFNPTGTGGYLFGGLYTDGAEWLLCRYAPSAGTTAEDNFDLTPSGATVGKIIHLAFRPVIRGWFVSGNFDADITVTLERAGNILDTSTKKLTYSVVNNKTVYLNSISATSGVPSGEIFRVKMTLKVNAGTMTYSGFSLLRVSATEAYIPGYIDACYNIGAHYIQEMDYLQIYNTEVVSGTKFGIMCVQTGVMSSWTPSN